MTKNVFFDRSGKDTINKITLNNLCSCPHGQGGTLCNMPCNLNEVPKPILTTNRSVPDIYFNSVIIDVAIHPEQYSNTKKNKVFISMCVYLLSDNIS